MVLNTLNENDYYNLHDLMTRGAAWNFIIGARGLGKTYAAKRYCIKDAIKNGHEFIYLRRTDVEQKKKETFFKDIQEAFPDYDFVSTAIKANTTTIVWTKNNGAYAVIS